MSGKPTPLRMADGLDPWERQPGEGERTYSYFALYRDMGRARTLTQAAQTLAVSAPYLRSLAAAHHWTDRAAAWDRESDRAYAQRMALLRRDMAEQDARLANSFLAKAAQRLVGLDVGDLSPGDLVRWCDFATRLRRLAYGDPEPVTSLPTLGNAALPGADYATMTPQQRLTRMTELKDELDRRITAAKALQGEPA